MTDPTGPEDDLRFRLQQCHARNVKLLAARDRWRADARELTSYLDTAVILPGRHRWPTGAEKWRSLIDHYLYHYGGVRYVGNDDEILDRMVGIEWFESSGVPDRVCEIEWVGTPPPGYDPDDDSTKASGLFQMVPLWWPERCAAAGFGGASIFDPTANVATACYMLYAGWPEGMPAPHWHHWSGASVGVRGSLEKVKEILDPLYSEEGP